MYENRDALIGTEFPKYAVHVRVPLWSEGSPLFELHKTEMDFPKRMLFALLACYNLHIDHF